MNIGRYSGIIYGILSSASFGLIPLFTVPVMESGMGISSLLFYRYMFAAIFITIYVLVTRQDVRVKLKDLPVLAILVTLAGATALCLLTSYRDISSGIATSIHFLYPVVVTILMIAFFKERSSLFSWISIGMAIAGVAMLSLGSGEKMISLRGLTFVLLSVLTYALYIIGVNKSRVGSMDSAKMTFYVLTMVAVMFAVYASVDGGIEPIGGLENVFNLSMLALVPTLLSNLTLILAIKHIGSTTTSILGSMEPLTAVAVGVCVFGEPFTSNLGIGITLIISAVMLVIISKKIDLKKPFRIGLNILAKPFAK